MATLLFVESSPREAKSASTTIAEAFVAAWRERNPGGTVDTLDVWDGELPEFDGAALQAKYAALSGQELTGDQRRAWSTIEAYAKRFQDADAFVFAIPMWNYTVPYKFKQLVDVVAQNGLLFDFHEDASVTGKLGGKPAVTIYAYGSYYDGDSPTPAADFDRTKPYMATLFRVIGLTNAGEITIEKTLQLPPDELERQIAGKSKEAAELAKRF